MNTNSSLFSSKLRTRNIGFGHFRQDQKCSIWSLLGHIWPCFTLIWAIFTLFWAIFTLFLGHIYLCFGSFCLILPLFWSFWLFSGQYWPYWLFSGQYWPYWVNTGHGRKGGTHECWEPSTPIPHARYPYHYPIPIPPHTRVPMAPPWYISGSVSPSWLARSPATRCSPGFFRFEDQDTYVQSRAIFGFRV